MGYHRLNIFCCLVLIVLAGCQNSGSEKLPDKKGRSSDQIVINFDERVTTLDPTKVTTEADKFIRDLVFEKLFYLDASGQIKSELINSWSYDTLSSTFSFVLKNRKFSDQTALTTEHISDLFKKLIGLRTDNDDLAAIFSSIKGYQRSEWYRINRQVVDHMPEGLVMTDSMHFDITTSSAPSAFLRKLAESDLLFVTKGDLGTAGYKIAVADSDLLYTLQSRKASVDTGYDLIHLRFLRSTRESVRLFLDEKIDLLTFKPTDLDSNAYTNYMYGQVAKPYPEHSIVESCQTKIKVKFTQKRSLDYLSVKNLPDQLRTTNLWVDSTVFVKESEQTATNDYSLVTPDSLIIAEPIQLEAFETEIVNTGQDVKDMVDIAVMKLRKEGKNPTIVAIESAHPYYYVAQANMDGLKPYMTLADIIAHTAFKEIAHY